MAELPPAPAPRLGFGAAPIGNLYRAMDEATAEATIDAALSAGIRRFDTAPHYGQGLSERRLGRALAGEACILSTKVGRLLKAIPPQPRGSERHGFVDGEAFEPEFDYSYDGVMRSFEDSYRRLKGAKVTTLLAHDLGDRTHGEAHDGHLRAFLDGGYRAMQELQDAGDVSRIGLGVNAWQVCEQVMTHADIDTILLAGRYTLMDQTALDSLLPLCVKKGVTVEIGGPFNSGLLTGGDHFDYAPASEAQLSERDTLRNLCRDWGVDLAAVALQFPLMHSAVTSVIAGMAHADEVAADVELMTTPIPAGLWSDLKARGLLRLDAPTVR